MGLAYRFLLERFNYCVGRKGTIGLVVADEQKEVEISTRKTTFGTGDTGPDGPRSST